MARQNDECVPEVANRHYSMSTRVSDKDVRCPHSPQLRRRLDSAERPIRRTGAAAQLNLQADGPSLYGRQCAP